MKEALQQIVDLLQPVAALADGTPFEHLEVIQKCVDASEIALEALAQQADHSEQHLDMVKAQPAHRIWVGLTEREVDECYELVMFNPDIEPTRVLVYQAIEAKLKEKNT